MVARRLYLHAGTAKTGTTSIQNWLDRNRDGMAAQGLLYPRIRHDSDQSPAFNRAHHILAFHWGVGWLKPAPEVTLAAWRDLAAQARAFDGDVAISSETFALAIGLHGAEMFDFIAELLPGVPVAVIFYLRNHADLIRSDAFEAIRNGQGMRSIWRHAVDPPWYMKALVNYRAMIEAAEAGAGVDRVLARPFEKAQFRGGALIEDFSHCLGRGGAAALGPLDGPPDNQFNDTNAIYLVLSQVVNLKFSKPRLVKRLCYQIAAEIGDDSGRFDWSREFADHLAAAAADDIAYLDARAGGRFFQETPERRGHHASGVEDRIARDLHRRLTGRPPEGDEGFAVTLNRLSEMDCAGLLDY